jgi:hypothetical protein
MSPLLKYGAPIWLVVTAVAGYELMGRAFVKGFEQGYVDGRASVIHTEEQVFLQCTAWWFDGNESRAMKEINKYCERRIK